ncbi:Retrovirus-related Pol poly [Paramuricea clavata]|uniref:Retrovirus-related Pol poly n=1 Tax=Paramuricea clavata TaxID=317549 RepID=A0A6S7FK42_PARCT|nr:Retrovirus-related Pol poly [Paramuricea clavata]
MGTETVRTKCAAWSRSAKECVAECIRNAMLSPPPATPPPATPSGDSEWLPETPDQNVNDESLTTFNECFSTLSTMLPSTNEFKPLQSRLSSTWEEASRKDQEQCIKTAKVACEMICDVIAPNAKDELLKSLGLGTAEQDAQSVSKELDILMWTYMNAPSKSLKTQILSIYADWYPVKVLMRRHEKYEKITEWQVRKAKEHAKKTGPGIPVENLKRHRVRVDMEKVDHFLDFINRPYFYQDVAFGTRNLELESGEILTMPNVVRIVTRSTMIALYISLCKDEEFEALSRSTLYRILEVRKSSQRKSLQGLDNTAADGAAAFDTLETVLGQIKKFGVSTKWIKSTKTALRESKRYLKTQYKDNCREDSSCADHCHVFALSDEKDKDFQKSCHDYHNTICDKCEKLKNVFEEIENKCNETVQSDTEIREDLLYDINNSKTSIENWKAHILRSENQDRAKQDVLKSVNSNTILILLDWAMKFTQLKYREKQSDWYAKRALMDVSKRVGIQVERYDYSEPQHGKDLCDRILCPLKTSIRKFCNEGNDITTAAQMRYALKERPVKGTTASVNIVNAEANKLEVMKLEGFSAFHNFCFECDGVRVWKAYGIGDGKLIPYGRWQKTPQGPTLLKVEEGQEFFNPSSSRVVKEPVEDKSEVSTYQCPEGECYAVFERLEDLDVHMEIGEHKKRERLGLYDKLKLDWVSRFTELTFEEYETTKPKHQENMGKSNLPKGWALHKSKGGGKRFPKAVKDYLIAKYDLGEKTGNKCDPEKVAEDMRHAKLQNGDRRFSREDWLNKSQIKSFFSRITAARRKQSQLGTQISIDPDDDDLDEWLDEVEVVEGANERNAIMNDVLSEIALQHPIIHDTYNLCELRQRNELKNFNVKMLKEICSELEVQYKSRDTKMIILDKLATELSKCTCSNI